MGCQLEPRAGETGALALTRRRLHHREVPAIDRPFEGLDLMTDLRKATRLTTLVVSAALIVAACGGSTAPAPVPAEPTPTPAAPEATPTPAAPEATPTPETTSFDLSGLTNNLSSFESYRIAVSVAGSAVYQATVVTKPEKAELITLGNESDSTKIIKIGTEAWMATGTDPYESVPLAMINGLIGAFDPILLLGAFANGDIGAIASDLGTEQKNGVDARHFRLDATSSLAGPFAALPAGAAIDFWVSADGYLVSYALTGAAADQSVSIDVTNVNDPANVVERPR